MNAIKVVIIILVENATDVGSSALTEEIKTNIKASKFNVGDRVRITKYKNLFSKK